MEKIAFISGGTFIYWSPIILSLAVLTAIAFFAAFYLWKGGSTLALCAAIPVAACLSLVLSRMIHWYCRSDGYESFEAAMTDYSWGGYALMGIFIGCILTACILRLLRVSRNLPQMLDAMAMAGGIGIAVGRLSFLFNASGRGVIVPDSLGLPFAYPVTNAVSGVVENRLATFMIQSMLAALIVGALLVYMLVCKLRKVQIKDGDIALLFLAAYGGCQIVCDSTRYDALYLRSNGFISVVQILGLVALVFAIVLFSIRMVKHQGLKWYHFVIWAAILALGGGAAFMEYYVQRHGDQALFAYSIMSVCVVGMIALAVLIRFFAIRQKKAAEEIAEESETVTA